MHESLLLLQQSPSLYITFTFILGLLVGSFLNVVIYRLPVMLKREWTSECHAFLNNESPDITPETKNSDTPGIEKFNLVVPRSRCPHCSHGITSWENIPVISYLIQAGKCTSCKAPISLRYPAIELLSASIAALVIWKFGFGSQALFGILLSWSLISLCMIDYDEMLLPDQIVLPFLWIGLLVNTHHIFTDLQSAVIGAIAGYLVLWIIYHSYRLLTGKIGMGYGDFKLLAMLGAWLGWQSLPAIILVSSLVGSVIGISLIIVKKHQADKPIPFGPYLIIAGWLVMMWGTQINQFIFNYLAL